MSAEIQDYSPNDYELLASWWSSRGRVPPTEIVLGSGEGYVLEIDHKPVAACWLYVCGAVAFLEWLMTKPGLSVSDARLACSRLEEHTRSVCVAEGVKQILGWVSTRVMAGEAQKHGYTVGSDLMAPIMKEVA